MIGNIENLCDPDNTQRFTCAGSKVVYNASVIWGTIGPQRMFQSGQVYNGLMYFFLIGVRVVPCHICVSLRFNQLTCDTACNDCTGVSSLPAIPQQLGAIH